MMIPFSPVYICKIFRHVNKYDCTKLIRNSFFAENLVRKVRGYPPNLQLFWDGPFGPKTPCSALINPSFFVFVFIYVCRWWGSSPVIIYVRFEVFEKCVGSKMKAFCWVHAFVTTILNWWTSSWWWWWYLLTMSEDENDNFHHHCC